MACTNSHRQITTVERHGVEIYISLVRWLHLENVVGIGVKLLYEQLLTRHPGTCGVGFGTQRVCRSLARWDMVPRVPRLPTTRTNSAVYKNVGRVQRDLKEETRV